MKTKILFAAFIMMMMMAITKTSAVEYQLAPGTGIAPPDETILDGCYPCKNNNNSLKIYDND
jgi:hypothetical protein